MDDEIKIKVARIETITEYIRDEITEIKSLLAKHVMDDNNNFNELRTKVSANTGAITYFKGKWSGIVLFCVVAWEVIKLIMSTHGA